MAYKPQDHYFRRAKQEGYRSRAAYKLAELQRRYRILRPGDAVVDLGAAPGGWLQVAAAAVGFAGKVVGVDLQAMAPCNRRNISLVQGDITEAKVQQSVKELIGGPADCVLSDLAPKLSGIRDADVARAVELNRTALRVAAELLRPGGSLVLKSFMSEELKTFHAEIKRFFASVERTKTEATRQGSSELYFLARGFSRPPGPRD